MSLRVRNERSNRELCMMVVQGCYGKSAIASCLAMTWWGKYVIGRHSKHAGKGLYAMPFLSEPEFTEF